VVPEPFPERHRHQDRRVRRQYDNNDYDVDHHYDVDHNDHHTAAATSDDCGSGSAPTPAASELSERDVRQLRG
jgi:hypothetical protein